MFVTHLSFFFFSAFRELFESVDLSLSMSMSHSYYSDSSDGGAAPNPSPTTANPEPVSESASASATETATVPSVTNSATTSPTVISGVVEQETGRASTGEEFEVTAIKGTSQESAPSSTSPQMALVAIAVVAAVAVIGAIFARKKYLSRKAKKSSYIGGSTLIHEAVGSSTSIGGNNI